MTSPSTMSGTKDSSITSHLPGPEEWQDPPLVAPGDCGEIKRLFRRRVGHLPPSVSYACPHPWMYRIPLYVMNPSLEEIDFRFFMQIYFVVTRDNACRYCYSTSRTALRVLGYSEEELDRFERDLDLVRRDEKRRSAFEFALRISRGQLECGSAIEALRVDGYTDTAIREIGGVAAVTALTNRLTTMLALPVNEGALATTRKWYFKLLRPLLGTLFPLVRRLGDRFESALTDQPIEGPFSRWIERVRGTPAGSLMHDVTTAWFEEESALSRRTKLLILAVVAQGLSCDELLERACGLLPADCEISETEFRTVVAHLQGDTVTDEEAQFLELARESIRYETSPFQRTTRGKTKALSRAKTLDLVGTIALSNGLARLGALASLDE